MKNEIFTIGYATFSIEYFVDALRKYSITAVADVRSAPYSRFKPEFKKNTIKKTLRENHIEYIFLGKHCGARAEDPSCYIGGKLNYALLKESENFQKGIKRILSGMQNYRIALMCAEKDPLNCHRTFLICRSLRSHPVTIKHILENDTLEEHAVTEKRLLKLYKLDQQDIFHSSSDLLEQAYDRQCEKITFNV
jgi:uncharacterized protein (DUF488 family)